MVYLPRFLISIHIYIYIYYYHYHYSIIINMSLACMLRTWSPKMVSFCKNMLLCIFLNQASVVLKDQSIICVRKWTMGLLICAVFFVAMLTKSEVACVFLHSYTVKGCHHMRPTDLVSPTRAVTKWWGAHGAPSAPAIVQFPSRTVHIYKDLLDRST